MRFHFGRLRRGDVRREVARHCGYLHWQRGAVRWCFDGGYLTLLIHLQRANGARRRHRNGALFADGGEAGDLQKNENSKEKFYLQKSRYVYYSLLEISMI